MMATANLSSGCLFLTEVVVTLQCIDLRRPDTVYSKITTVALALGLIVSLKCKYQSHLDRLNLTCTFYFITFNLTS